jgi:hypothetical protein
MSALLEKFVGEHPEAPSLSGHLSQLEDARKRMDNVNLSLTKIQGRLDRLHLEHGQSQ